jgi:hypothetical protein
MKRGAKISWQKCRSAQNSNYTLSVQTKLVWVLDRLVLVPDGLVWG